MLTGFKRRSEVTMQYTQKAAREGGLSQLLRTRPSRRANRGHLELSQLEVLAHDVDTARWRSRCRAAGRASRPGLSWFQHADDFHSLAVVWSKLPLIGSCYFVGSARCGSASPCRRALGGAFGLRRHHGVGEDELIASPNAGTRGAPPPQVIGFAVVLLALNATDDRDRLPAPPACVGCCA